MSWRIEIADPLALLRELPDGWVQTSVLRPPRDLPAPCLVAILDELRRVLRADGTLWACFPGHGRAPAQLRWVQETGWLRAENVVPPRSRREEAVTLFSKQREFHFDPRRALGAGSATRAEIVCPARPAGRRVAAPRLERRAWCVWSGAGRLSTQLISWCVLSATSPCACGFCGAPWRRYLGESGQSGARWRPGCSHGDGHGRCLVLDPFCGLAETGVVAVRANRGYLGVASTSETAQRARRRLDAVAREARR